VRAVDERAAEILTPEHVPLRLEAAGLGSRFLAWVADSTLIAGLIIASAMVLGTLGAVGGVGPAAITVVSFVVLWGYHIYFEMRHHGRTLGKRMLRLRVVDRRGLPITFQQSFVRNIARALDFAPILYGVGGVAALLDRHHRRLGDLAADTLVIQEREGDDVSRHLGEERRFNTLRTPGVLRRLRRKVGLEEREMLLSLVLRAERMDPRARFDLMEEVGNHYRKALEIDDPHLSGENIVRGLLAILYTERS
jgi:uncharacterized RDD family membrane protein YckC